MGYITKGIYIYFKIPVNTYLFFVFIKWQIHITKAFSITLVKLYHKRRTDLRILENRELLGFVLEKM